MKYLLTLVFAALSLNVVAASYPISPMPLRKLVEKSQYIIVGYVFDIKPAKNGEGDQIARIAVKESLQGQIEQDTIEIQFSPNMVCPTPDEYFKGTFVLSFLVRSKSSKTGKLNYRSVALNYGAKTLPPEGIAVYKDRIAEFQRIATIENNAVRFSETVECLVKCGENPVTRWEGTYELSPESDFMSFYSTSAAGAYAAALSDNQKLRLKKALLDESEANYVDFGLADLVYEGNEYEIDTFLIAKLRVLQPNDYWYAGDYMRRLKHLDHSGDFEKLLARYESVVFGGRSSDNDKKRIINEFLNRIGQQ